MIAALVVAAPVASDWTAGLSAAAGAALHDGYSDGTDPVATGRAFVGERLTDHVAVVLTAQFAWTREQSHDSEFQGAWAAQFALIGIGAQFDAGRFRLQAGLGGTLKNLPHWHTTDTGPAYFAAASVAIWSALRLEAGVTRFSIDSNSFQPAATVVSGGLGVSF